MMEGGREGREGGKEGWKQAGRGGLTVIHTLI